MSGVIEQYHDSGVLLTLATFWATTVLTEVATSCRASACTQLLLCSVSCHGISHTLALNKEFEISAGTQLELPVTCSWGCAVQLPRAGRKMLMSLLFLKST